MANQVTLRAETRSTNGKGAARSLRREGKIPAVIYGHNREAESVVVEASVLRRALVGISAESTIIDVSIGDRAAVKALIREIQRDSLRPSDILHVDFYEVSATEAITVSVPVHLTGTAEGVRLFGGVLDHILHSLEVECLPADIPASIDLDVTNLGLGDSITVSDVQVANVTVLNDPGLPICAVVATRADDAAAAPVEGAPATPELIRKPKTEDAE